MEISLFKELQRWALDLDQVFTIKDLQVVFNKKSNASFYRDLKGLLDEGDLIKIKRGIYTTPKATLISISSRIFPKSYISTGTVLAKNAIIGSIPARRIQAIKTGSPRTFTCPLGTIEYLSIAPKLYFGFERVDQDNIATKEKAFLDVCYFYYKRKRFSFDPVTDINLDDLDFNIIRKYLKKYDQRFSTFFKQIWIDK